MSKIKVDLGKRSYDIVVGFGNLKNAGQALVACRRNQKPSKIAIITDPMVDSFCGEAVRKSLKGFKVFTLRVPMGEKYKTLATASALYDQLVHHDFHRDDLIVALGGGVIGDLAGFVAGTYMRGLKIIQIPTTLLAMVDASIGGKTGVDHKVGKNMIGVFHQPYQVLIDIETLKTLPPRELRTGLAEVVKYGIISDPQIFKLLESDPKANSAFWVKIISLSAGIKAKVVSQDERETKGLREILNFGHTIGHALESSSGYTHFTHGEAVALGMIAASAIAVRLKLLKASEFARIKALIGKLKLPTCAKFDSNRVLDLLKHDKKVKADKIRFVLPVKIGKVVVKDKVPLKVVQEALEEIM